MIPVDQTVLGDRKGNCEAAAIASVLGLPLEDVPHFMLEDDWQGAENEFLAQFGLKSLILDATSDDSWRPSGYHLISGKSPRGPFWHTVVGLDGEIVHDPHPSRSGLDEEQSWTVFVATLEHCELFVRCPACGSERAMVTHAMMQVCECGHALA